MFPHVVNFTQLCLFPHFQFYVFVPTCTLLLFIMLLSVCTGSLLLFFVSTHSALSGAAFTTWFVGNAAGCLTDSSSVIALCWLVFAELNQGGSGYSH